ncbi:MAG: pyridoxamine 5'-phosphate oxidase family protein [Proteobacteria bacterium]|nr:pyridoxamine 5'-phosphate oxidase family protein [Pseudomonadota bacterium]
MQDELHAQVLAYLRDHRVVTLATGADGDLWAAAVFYVNDGFRLYFLSSPTSRHSLNLVQQPRVAATIQEDYSDWLEIKGIQLEGVASEISGDEELLARSLYAEKFPVVGKLAQAPAAIVKAMAKVRWYQLVPQRLYFIDNAAGFGRREEIDLARGPSPE